MGNTEEYEAQYICDITMARGPPGSWDYGDTPLDSLRVVADSPQPPFLSGTRVPEGEYPPPIPQLPPHLSWLDTRVLFGYFGTAERIPLRSILNVHVAHVGASCYPTKVPYPSQSCHSNSSWIHQVPKLESLKRWVLALTRAPILYHQHQLLYEFYSIYSHFETGKVRGV